MNAEHAQLPGSPRNVDTSVLRANNGWAMTPTFSPRRLLRRRKTELVELGTLLALLVAVPGCAGDRPSGEADTADHGELDAPPSAAHDEQARSPHAHAPGEQHHRMSSHTEQPTNSQPQSGSEVVLPAMKDSAGEEFRLELLRGGEGREGRIIVLTIWCTTCHSCRAIEHDFDTKAKEYEAKGVRFLMVASSYTDTPELVNQFLAKRGLGFTVLMDAESDVPRYFGAKTTTTTAVIDAAGRLRYYGGFPKAEDAVRNLLAGEDVAVPETHGFG